MTSREAFEAHIQAKTGERPQMIGGFDTNLRWREDWEIWRAAYEAGRTAEKQECKRVCELEINRLSAIGEHRAALAVNICAAKIDERGKP